MVGENSLVSNGLKYYQSELEHPSMKLNDNNDKKKSRNKRSRLSLYYVTSC